MTWRQAFDYAARTAELLGVRQRVYRSRTYGWAWEDARPGTRYALGGRSSGTFGFYASGLPRGDDE